MPDFDFGLQAQFKFAELFNQLGWENPPSQGPLSVNTGDVTYVLDVVVHKRGVQILHCRPDADGRMPEYAIRQKIDRKVTPEAREHLIIFTDAAKTTQVWQWVARAPGRPNQYREVSWRKGESAELLKQKLSAIAFTLDEEERLLVTDVTRKLSGGFDRDKVTKKFYPAFDAQRLAFTEFIAGIPQVGNAIAEDQRWYAAVLIDRLMFLWFLQEKRFLNDKKDYLQQRLLAHSQSAATQSFYRAFLCPLFFRGFAEQRTAHNRVAIEAEFGKVPYLNGGLFAQHELERRYGDALDVEDAAFSKLFEFFAKWDWHLDDRPLGSGKEINPDVLGYIFEKFVNQKQMGAYYTKEDITDYIGKNTIIPCLLAKVRAEHPRAFDELAWSMLKESGDTYIYPAMLKGMPPLPLAGEGWGEGGGMPSYPADIAIGLDVGAPDLLDRRKSWNKRANEAASLPTEIWRETIARHQRTREVRAKIAAGELRDVGDLITYNLDIRLFAQQLIERCTDIALLKSFWFALAGRLPQKSNEKYRHGLTVLDPTCGSGAFLLAALNILKPLYDATLRAMHAIRNDALIAGAQSHPETWKEIDGILVRFATNRPDRVHDYAVTKHIIVNNLYGVDIEEQATEIAKLRLFLKLVALLEPGDEIEPLPDIDFNIRHGNTLIGYATEAETKLAVEGPLQGQFDFGDTWQDIRVLLARVEQEYNNFQIQQVQHGGHVSADDKIKLENKLSELEGTLNYYLAKGYGIDQNEKVSYDQWKSSNQPFHWYVDFYPLMAAGGFDAVIGNPPYVQLSQVSDYGVSRYLCADCGNLYAVMLERCMALVDQNGRTGFIVPVSAISTDGYSSLQQIYALQDTYVSCFDDRPSRLFDGLEHIRLVILLAQRTGAPRWLMTRYHKWTSEERPSLFSKLLYVEATVSPIANTIAKMGNELERSILRKVMDSGKSIATYLTSGSQSSLNYSRKVGYFLQILDFEPVVLSGDGSRRPPSEFKTIFFSSTAEAHATLAELNGSLFYWFITLLSDCRHLNKREVEAFPIASALLESPLSTLVSEAVQTLMNDLQAHSENRVMNFRHDCLTVQCILPKKSWSAIQRVDKIIADAFHLSPIEEDYIANYDFKYRMGQSG
jgi:hypothetical protein